ncbi:hypothetical protein [Nocardia rhizosphaerihabitans]|nr:hypothetical protein [Nocardia rhizosphaerihabitans]
MLGDIGDRHAPQEVASIRVIVGEVSERVTPSGKSLHTNGDA